MRWISATVITLFLVIFAVPGIQVAAYNRVGAPEWTMGITILSVIWIVFMLTWLTKPRHKERRR